MQQPDARESQKKTYFKLSVECAVTCSNPGCKRELSVCGRTDHLRMQGQPGAAAAVPGSTSTAAGRVAQARPGAGLAVSTSTTCPYCHHVTEVPIVYCGHEEQAEGGHVTEKGSPIREETSSA
ncbi:negative regulation of cell migration [Branchiostoma belcheri]|nr:negative regulation of cell migration [Branchiostoma belcheri]